MKRIVIIANGPINDIDFYKKIIQKTDFIICADGGANTAKKIKIMPNIIIGDLDSIKPEVLKFYKSKTKIIRDENQNKTDLELAIKIAEEHQPEDIIIIGATGGRIDHTLANILSIVKINKKINTSIIDNHASIKLIDKNSEILEKKDETISIIPLTKIKNLEIKGLKWDVEKQDTNFGWFGISNKIRKEQANINFSEGKILIIKVRDDFWLTIIN